MKEETGESFDRMTKWMENSKSEILDRTRYMFATGKIEASRCPYQFLIATIYRRKLVYDINKFVENN
jgi:hypothetical protein